MPALMPLYPLTLTVQTPHGTARFHPAVPPPTAFQARPHKRAERAVSITGRSILSFAEQAEGWELTLAVPDRNAQPLAVARPLQQCEVGDQVTITENLTDRLRERTWVARVMVSDQGAWVAGNPADGDRFTLQMQFFAATFEESP